MERTGAKIRFNGIVQGVGFRPFLFRLATQHGLVGYVRNMGDAGVEVYAEGDRSIIDHFVDELKKKAPPVCQVSNVRIESGEYSGAFREFTIRPSDQSRTSSNSMIPPDIAICEQCGRDILGETSRWCLYPFTCCASCGPRFTAVFDLPYDRARTHMAAFPMCPDCRREYEDPNDRRFHAQGICCPSCGPKLVLYDRGGNLVEEKLPLREAAHLLDEGMVLGVKGIGGVHVAASAIRDEPILQIRRRKTKPFQPFAVMARSVSRIREFACVSDVEANLLQSWQRPIVVLRKLPQSALSEIVAPGLDTVGVMLPYTGIHLLLTDLCRSPAIVMTSGNISGLPMAIANDEAIQQLSDVVDYFLLHDREIVSRCDDSVVRVLDDVPTFIRRSRGYIPAPIDVPMEAGGNVIGVGAELRNVGSLLRGTRCYLTQHIGDVDDLETLVFLKGALEYLVGHVGIPDAELVVAHDAHPRYLSSKLAGELSDKWNGRAMTVQHHHAHAASLMADNMIPTDESIIAIAADGVGFGTDGDIWGGEVLVSSYRNFERVGHLARQPMPGGDICTILPLRMCAAMLCDYIEDDRMRKILLSKEGTGSLNEADLDRIRVQVQNRVAMSWTSSTGRVLDAMASGAGICLQRTYEGEPAMRLEAVAMDGNPSPLMSIPNLILREGEVLTVDTTRMLATALLAIDKKPLRDICASFQYTLVMALASIAVEAAKERGIRRVGITGGVAVNARMVATARKCVEERGLAFLQHRQVPPGDGGISLGQAIVAASRL